MPAARYSMPAPFHVPLRESKQVLKLQPAIAAAPVAVFSFIIDERIGPRAAVVRLVVDFEAGERLDKQQPAFAARVKLEVTPDEFATLPAAQRQIRRAATPASGCRHHPQLSAQLIALLKALNGESLITEIKV